jgi:hypothetical protein
MRETPVYIPGICNINREEINKRRKIGFVGLAALAIVIVLLLALHTPVFFRVVAIIPAFLMAIGFLQARGKFCVGFASAGKQHTDGDVVDVVEAEAHKHDMARARKMNLRALVIALIITAVFITLP